MLPTSDHSLLAAIPTRHIHIDSNLGSAASPIKVPLHTRDSADAQADNEHTSANPEEVVKSEDTTHSLERRQEDKSGADEYWRTEDEVDSRHAAHNEDEAPLLENDPAKMSSWAGQPSVKGSSEAMRMMLLTFSSVGMTFVQHRFPKAESTTDNGSAASRGASK